MIHRVLLLGVTGMLGHTLLRELGRAPELDVYGTARRRDALRAVPEELRDRVTTGIDATDTDAVRQVLDTVRPDVVVNCVGVIKQHPGVEDPVNTIAVNALLPHLLARICAGYGSRLIQVSTDCVFSGERGGYTEADLPDPRDLYGRSKLLGEVTAAPALTLRTSIIGHELASNRSLVDWFLSRTGVVRGYTRAIYTGVTTVEFARLLRSVVLPRPELSGLYHVAAAPISKYELLRLIADAYGWNGQLVPYDEFHCDRSLRAEAFHAATGYRPPPWPEMIADLRAAATAPATGTAAPPAARTASSASTTAATTASPVA